MIFIDACYRRPTPRPPVWMMRQAGRYLPEYRAVRAKHGFLEMCRNPEIARDITLQPVDRFDVDAAIIFCDILMPLPPMGFQLRIEEGTGPVIDNPVTSFDDVQRLVQPDMARDLGFLKEALTLTRAALAPQKALIGFAGAPFTLACYAVQGRGGNQFEKVRQWMFTHPATFDALLEKFSEMTVAYLKHQVAGGAQALQIFDSWGGLLSAYDYLHRVFPHIQRILEETADLGVPRILFVKGASHFRDFLRIARAEVIGLDWTMPIEQSRAILGDEYAVQGNMDPMYLFADPEFVSQRTLAMIENNQGQPGYIVNLGHGINKETPLEGVRAFVETVLRFRYRDIP